MYFCVHFKLCTILIPDDADGVERRASDNEEEESVNAEEEKRIKERLEREKYLNSK